MALTTVIADVRAYTRPGGGGDYHDQGDVGWCGGITELCAAAVATVIFTHISALESVRRLSASTFGRSQAVVEVPDTRSGSSWRISTGKPSTRRPIGLTCSP